MINKCLNRLVYLILIAIPFSAQISQYPPSGSGSTPSVTCADVGGNHLNTNATGTAYVCGTSIGSHYGNQFLLNWGPTISDGACVNNTFTLAGADTGDALAPIIPSGLPVNVSVTMYVTSTNIVTVTVCNLSGSSATISAVNWGAKDIK